MSHQITDIALRLLRANCTFNYKGFIISISTIFNSGQQVGLFMENDRNFQLYFDTVEEAINHVNSVSN